MPPLRELFGALRGRGLADERREHDPGRVVLQMRERLERLVREVDRVTFVDEDVIRRGREHHRFRVGDVRGIHERGLEHPFGRVGGACLDETPVPLREPVDGHPVTRQRADREVRRATARVVRDCDETVHQCERAIVPIEIGEEVGHRNERGESAAPTGIAVARAELDAGPYDLARFDPRVEQPEHRLGDDERDVLFEPLPQSALEVRDHVGVRAGADDHVVAADLDVEAAARRRPRGRGCTRTRGRSGRGASGR